MSSIVLSVASPLLLLCIQTQQQHAYSMAARHKDACAHFETLDYCNSNPNPITNTTHPNYNIETSLQRRI
jgi:hypothetical protein